MWVVRQADEPFVCFGAKPTKGLGLEISDETGSGGGKELAKEPREGQLAKEPRERQLVERETQRGSQEWTAEGTRWAVLSRQKSPEVSSEGRTVKMSWHS